MTAPVTDADRAQLRAGIKHLLAEQSPEAAVRTVMESESGFDEDLWRRLVGELGVLSLLVPEAYGGAGYGWREAAVPLGETGAALYPGPLLSSVFATVVLTTLGEESAREELLPAIADGSTHATFAAAGVARPGAAPGALSIRPADPGSVTVSGSVGKVLDAHLADAVLILTRDGDVDVLLLVDSQEDGLTVAPVLGMDLTRRLAEVRLENVLARVVGASLAAPDLDRAYGLLALALGAEQLGGADAAFANTLDFLRTRVQFGRQIGSFQAIKHRCADLAVDLESARSSLEAGLYAADADLPDLVLYAHLAEATCSDAYLAVARAMIQLHGGIGFTWEHSAHLHLKRAKTGQLLLGLPATHRRLVAAAAGLHGIGSKG